MRICEFENGKAHCSTWSSSWDIIIEKIGGSEKSTDFATNRTISQNLFNVENVLYHFEIDILSAKKVTLSNQQSKHILLSNSSKRNFFFLVFYRGERHCLHYLDWKCWLHPNKESTGNSLSCWGLMWPLVQRPGVHIYYSHYRFM